MAFLHGVIKRAGLSKPRQPLETWTRAFLPGRQNFHTCQRYFISKEEKPEPEAPFPEQAETKAKRATRNDRSWTASEKANLLQMRIEGRRLTEICEVLGRSRDAILKRLPKFSPSDDEKIVKAQQEGMSWQQLSDQMPCFSLRQILRRWNTTLKRGSSGEFQPPSRRFTAQEDEQLKKLRGQGLPWPKIAQAMEGRQGDSVMHRYNRIVPKPERVEVRHRQWWTKDDLQKLQAMGTEKDHVVAKVLGKTPNSVQIKRSRLRSIDVEQYTGRKEWTKDENRLCLELSASGKTCSEIGKIMRKTPRSIDARLARLKQWEKTVGDEDSFDKMENKKKRD